METPSWLQYDNTRFHIPSNFTDRQFYDIYNDRLTQLAPKIIPRFKAPFVDKINEVVSGKECSIVGVVYKDLAERQSILENYKTIGYESQAPEEIESSANDVVYLEDKTSRIELVGVPPEILVTGIVMGVTGVPENGKIIIKDLDDVFFPEDEDISNPEVEEGHRIIFISDLCINTKSADLKKKQNALIRLLNGVDLAVFLGNNFMKVEEPNVDELLSFNDRIEKTETLEVSKFVSFLNAAKAKHTIIMPGEHDPCTIALPQQPYHPVLIKTKSFILSTNPSKFHADGLTFLCDAGESPISIQKSTKYSFHEAQCQLLNWMHVAPTAPDQLPCIPVKEKDVLCMEEYPHVFVSGLADEFNTTLTNGVNIISVPSLDKTFSVVEFNTKTRIAQEIKL